MIAKKNIFATEKQGHEDKHSPVSSVPLRLCGLIVLLFMLAGCGYHFAGSGENRLDSRQNIWVAFITNETVSPSAQTVLRRALLEEVHVMRGLAPAGDAANADLLVSGVLRSYTLKAISYNAIDRAREYRLYIDVELEMRRRGEKAPYWKGTLNAFQDFPANDDLGFQHNSEEAALAAASRKLAQKFLSALEQSY